MKQQKIQRDFYSIAEAAKRIGCSRGFLGKQCKENKIPYTKLGSRMFIPAKFIQNRIDEVMPPESKLYNRIDEAIPPKLRVYICKKCGTYTPNWKQE